jgi:aryl-alcohol dehydrogenase-like predicted oxidoreductase
METRQLGRTDMRVSVLGFGGSEIGYAGASPAEVEQLLGAALDAGLNVIDTAECYRTSEERIGGLRHRRKEFYLFTKCGHASGLPGADWDPAMLAQSIDRSLQRLRTDCVDLIQLHSCSAELLRRGEVIDVLQRARAAGKTRYIGYSGDGQNALYAVRCGAFDTLQTSVNVADQEAIDLTIPEAVGAGMGVIAKRPIANAAWREGRKPADPYAHTYWDRLQRLAHPALTVETALRFTASVPGVCTAIVGTTKPGRWAENAALLAAGPLPPAAYESIRARWRAVATSDWVGQT